MESREGRVHGSWRCMPLETSEGVAWSEGPREMEAAFTLLKRCSGNSYPSNTCISSSTPVAHLGNDPSLPLPILLFSIAARRGKNTSSNTGEGRGNERGAERERERKREYNKLRTTERRNNRIMGESEDYRIYQARKGHSRTISPSLLHPSWSHILYNGTLHLVRSSSPSLRPELLESKFAWRWKFARLIAPRLNLCKSVNVVGIQRRERDRKGLVNHNWT